MGTHKTLVYKLFSEIFDVEMTAKGALECTELNNTS